MPFDGVAAIATAPWLLQLHDCYSSTISFPIAPPLSICSWAIAALAPTAARAGAVAFPMPEETPVKIATLPVNRSVMVSG